MYSKLAESKNYLITNEDETVTLSFKNENREIVIGDFYGNPQVAVISDDEKYCVMGGCGIIIYYLKEPYDRFEYKELNKQWKELFRQPGNITWIEDIEKINDTTICLSVENIHKEEGDKYTLNVYSFELTKI